MRILIAALLWASIPVAARAADRPLIALLDPPAIAARCDEGLAKTRAMIATMEKAGGDGFFGEWNALQVAIEDTLNPISVLGSLSPDKAVRDAAEPCLRKYTALRTEIFQNERVFRRVNAAHASPGSPEARLRANLIEGFEDSGVALPPERRARASALFARLEELRQAFQRNVREDATRVVFTPAQMEGLPASYLGRQKRDAEGDYVLGLDEPSYMTFMTNARSEAARKRYYLARFNKGGEANIGILDEAFRLRKELAGLYGLPSYAHYALRRKMARTPEAVGKFLGEVRQAITAVERRELEELTALKAKETGDAGARLARWDAAYYTEKVRRERFAVDQEGLRRHFPTGKAVAYAMRVAEILYGIRFREVQVPVWLPEVRYFDMLDAASGKYLAGVYLDLSRATASAAAPGPPACGVAAAWRGARRYRRSRATSTGTASSSARWRRSSTSSATCCTTCCRRPTTSRSPARA